MLSRTLLSRRMLNPIQKATHLTTLNVRYNNGPDDIVSRMFQEQQKAKQFQRSLQKAKRGGDHEAGENPIAYMEISRDGELLGRMTFELFAEMVPKTVENFRSLLAGDNEQGYAYEKSTFHRVKGGFTAQGGDFDKHDGSGGKSIYGDTFDDEMAGLLMSHNKRGILSMNNKGKKNTNQS